MLDLETKNLRAMKQKIREILKNDEVEKVIYLIISFIIGLITTRGLAFGKYAPFPVAFVSAVPKRNVWSATMGAVLGYLLPSPIHIPFRYIVAVLAVAAIRWALSELKKINSSQAFAPLITLMALLSTGIFIAIIEEATNTMPALYVAEAFLASGIALFFKKTINIIYTKKFMSAFDNIDIASLAVSLGVIILSFNEIAISGISVGRILMVIMILLCAGAGGITGGAIAGIVAGAIGGLSGFGISYLSGAYGLGGLMSGIFSGMSKFFGAIAFVIAHGVASIQLGSNINVINAAIEVSVATIIYMLVPQSRKIENIFASRREKLSGDSLRDNIIMKLNHSSKALTSVASSVDEISRKLIESNRPKPSYVLNQSASDICAACMKRAVCWRKNKQETIKAFASTLPYLKAKGEIVVEDFPEFFTERCGRIGEMKNAINRNYKRFQEKQIAEIRSANVREVASEQFKVTSAMLHDMASEISLFDSFDEESAYRVMEVFRRMDIVPSSVSCKIDRYGRMSIEAEIEKTRDTKLGRTNLISEVSKACGRPFSSPCISNAKYSYKIQMCQKPLLDVSVGMAQESASELCGDSAVSFYDGQGHYIAILSDGMGTGGMAAVDGAMAASIMENLLKAGIGYDTALRMTNSALMSKSEDETLSTVDIVSLDLHSGRCEFRKAGATASFVKKGNKVISVEEDSLPVGIMPDVRFSLNLENLKKGDIILVVSDGVTSFGTDWIKEEMYAFDGKDPNELAKDIVLYAKQSRNDGHCDDITALVMIISSNEKEI